MRESDTVAVGEFGRRRTVWTVQRECANGFRIVDVAGIYVDEAQT